jgi:phage gpG-like protein
VSKFRFDKKKIDTNKLLTVMSNNAVNYFKVDVFNSESFDGKAWVPKKVKDGRRTLVKTSRMRSSIRELKRGRNYVQIGSDVPYSKYHNEGTNHIPKRQFIGKAKQIENYNRISIQKAQREAIRK